MSSTPHDQHPSDPVPGQPEARSAVPEQAPVPPPPAPQISSAEPEPIPSWPPAPVTDEHQRSGAIVQGESAAAQSTHLQSVPPQPAQASYAQAQYAQVQHPQPQYDRTQHALSEHAQPEYAQSQPAVQYAPASGSGVSGGGSLPPAFGGPVPPAPAPEAPRQRHGGLIAGLAVGALIGGLVGGGTAAVVAHNAGGQTVVQAERGESLTLNNLDSATAITGVAAVATPSVVTLQVIGASTGGSGSGVIYSEDGYIITNAHVATLEGATSNPTIRVQTSDGSLYDGVLVGSDPFADLAVIKVEAEGLTPIAIADSEKINVGDLAVAIGAPLNLANTVTSGVVSALNRGISVSSSMVTEDEGAEPEQNSPFPWFQFETPNEQQGSAPAARVAIPVLQTDASINPGNSGGALLNANGELIGINVALASPTVATGAAGSDGLGFAVPVNLATRVADALIAGERPSHGLLGVTQTTSGSTVNQAGGVIGQVNPGSPAEAAGLMAGDVITSIDGALADSFTTVTALVRMHAGGSEVVIGYNRDGEQRETTVVLDTLEW